MSFGSGVHLWVGFGEGFWGFLEGGGPIRASRGFSFSGFPQISPPVFCLVFCRVLSAVLMQSMRIESTRSILENISPDHSSGGFNVSRFCCILDEPRADSGSSMHPSIDHDTRSTPLSSSELTILGRLIDLR